MAELVYQTWERITGTPWSQARKMGLTDGQASTNLALQKRLMSGWNPMSQSAPAPAPAPAPTPAASSPAPAQEDPMAAYKKMIADWYSQKPATPATFSYSPDQEASDKLSVSQQYRPFYQEKATQSGDAFKTALNNAKMGFSRRGLWGASGDTQKSIDPSTGLEYTTMGEASTVGGPVSGLRQQGLSDINKAQTEGNTAFGRAYGESVATGVQNRRNEAYDVYQKTIRQPYEDQYKAWQDRLTALTAGVK